MPATGTMSASWRSTASLIAFAWGLGASDFKAKRSEAEIAGQRCILLKPQTFMNESGRSVGEAARFLKIEPDDVIVLHDELDLVPGKLKVKTGGGNAGHNGLRSTTQHIGNEYVRLRIGIGHPGHKDLVHGYVLHDFARIDMDWLDPVLDAIAEGAAATGAGRPGTLHDRSRAADARRGRRNEAGGEPAKSCQAASAAARRIRPASAPASGRARWPRT